MADDSVGGGDAVEQERAMREHEREAQEREPESSAESSADAEADRPAPPGGASDASTTSGA